MSLPAGIIVSDIHLGDPLGVALHQAKVGYAPAGPLFIRQAWLDWMARVDSQLAAAGPGGRIPLLVLAGDFWDVAIRNIDEIADLSLAFFGAVEMEKRFDSILFLPGNHDHYLWSLVQIQSSIIRPLENRRTVGSQAGGDKIFQLPRAQCATLDFRAPGTPVFAIDQVQSPYVGNIFVSGLTGGRIPVNVAYPNLHILRADGGACVVTHGHFFQLAWTLISDLLKTSMGLSGGMNLYYLELLNAGLTDFINYALAQTGPLSDTVQRIYTQFRQGVEPPELQKVLAALQDLLDKVVDFKDQPWWKEKLEEWGSDRLIGFELALLKKFLEHALRNAEGAQALPQGRTSVDFLGDPDNTTKIADYLTCSRRDPSLGGIKVDELVFGHTHESIAAEALPMKGGDTLRCWNPGSLVSPVDRCDFMPLAIDGYGRIGPF